MEDAGNKCKADWVCSADEQRQIDYEREQSTPNATAEGRRGAPYHPATGSALIRRCNGCRRVTAVDVEDTPEHRREMEMPGQTVEVVTRRDADMHWYEGGPCICRQNAEHLARVLPSPECSGSQSESKEG
jgi:hypothetical protein